MDSETQKAVVEALVSLEHQSSRFLTDPRGTGGRLLCAVLAARKRIELISDEFPESWRARMLSNIEAIDHPPAPEPPPTTHNAYSK